jgi:hypothetical protein
MASRRRKKRSQQASAGPRTNRPRPRSSRRLIVGGLAVIVAGVVAAWYSTNGSSTKIAHQRSRTGQSSTRISPTAIRTDSIAPINADHGWDRIDDPNEDGWHTEVFSQKANKQLKEIAKLIANIAKAKEIETTRVASLATETFECQQLIPQQRQVVFEDDHLQIEQATGDQGDAVPTHRGPGQLLAALRQLATPWLGANDIRLKFKLFRVAESDGVWTTRQYLEIFGTGATGMVEQNSLWVIRWRAQDHGPPQVDSIQVERFEQVTSSRRETWFADHTASAIGHNESYSQQVLHGLNHWLGKIQDMHPTTQFGTNGITLGDVNGDDLDDLYVCQEGGLPNLLFVQRANGTLDDVSRPAGVDWLHATRCALLVDLDNDGDQDLGVAMLGHLVLAENDGDGRFEVRRTLSTSQDNISLTAADYDLDGDLDLYVGSSSPDDNVDDPRGGGISVPDADFVFHDANDSAANTLFRNDGAWEFLDVTDEVGLSENNARRTLAASWEDFDNDGDQDLYVANDFGRNSLYRNDRDEGFVDVADELAVEDRAAGMAVTWGDYDRDGRMDLYVSNMFSSAGNRIMFQSGFKPDISDQERAVYKRFAKGNTLFRNKESSPFDEVSAVAGVEMGRWAWSSNFADINNDGWEDLIVANGYITTDDSGDL